MKGVMIMKIWVGEKIGIFMFIAYEKLYVDGFG